MRWRILAVFWMLALPLAGHAQNPAQEGEGQAAAYRALFDHYYPHGEAGGVGDLAQGLALVPRLAGRWVEGQILFPDGVLEADRLQRGCEMRALQLTPTGRFGFTMTEVRRGELRPAVTTYSFVGAATFTRSTDIEAQIAEIFGDRPLDEMIPQQWLSVPSAPMHHGYATLRMPGDDILAIEPISGPGRILLRCPS